MTILLIHFSDIHIRTDEDPILGRVSAIANVLKEKLTECNDVFAVISGDIAYSGNVVEYDLASRFFAQFEKELKAINESVNLNYIIVPGNHDCVFEPGFHGDSREQLIQDILKDHQLLQKTGIVFDCIKPMQNYLDWVSGMLPAGIKTEQEKFAFERAFEFPDRTKIKFIGYNTAWMSLPEKGHGDILFPIHLVPPITTHDSVDLVFSLLHHPYNWVRADISRTFRDAVEATSNVIITGHEHLSSYQSTTYLFGETRQYIQGGELQNENDSENSTFNTILVDIPKRLMKYTRYSWRKNLYTSDEFEWTIIPRSKALKQDKFIISESHAQFLTQPGVPFSHPRKPNLSIDDIYVFPDLEELTEKPEGEFIHSSKALDYLLTSNKLLVFGPENSGKTSLLKIMFREYQRNEVVPLWVDGMNIRTGDPQRLKTFFNSAFNSIYDKEYLEDFWQLEPTKRLLIIDDLQDSNLNRKTKLKLFDFIENHFGLALISSSNPIAIQEIIETEKNEFLVSCKRVLLFEFGNVSRDKIIEKWLLLGQEETIQDIQLDSKIKEIDEKTKVILRPSLAPSYPFFILTVAQSVDNMGSTVPPLSNEDRGSFGFFYEWLITTALHRSPKKISDVSLKYRYLSELSYYMYEERKISIDSEELEAFHNSYLQRFSLRYIDLRYEDMLSDLISSGLLQLRNGYYNFEYPCIYYYFVARALNSRLQQPKHEKHVKEMISRLADQIDIQENENILLFLSYLSENPYIRDTLLQTAKKMFADFEPADLENDVQFINKEDFELALKLPDEKPRKVRQLIHEQEDKERRERFVRTKDTSKVAATTGEEEIDERLKLWTRAFKLVRVIGQIVKNFATSWEGPDKYPITEESYLLGLRVLKEVLTLYAQHLDEFVEQAKDALRFRIDKEMLSLPPDRRHILTDSQLEILARATAFAKTFLVSFNTVFAIARNVGSQKLYPTHKQILDEHNHLMSVRLIDVAIKLDCQMRLPIKIIAEILHDLDKNHLSKAILKRLAFHRMILYETDRTDRERCCRMLGIEQDDPRLLLPDRKIGKT